MKRRWVAIAVIVGTLTVGLTGGAILAQEDPGDGSSPVKSLISRVAGILGLEETQVQEAFDQAREEMRDEALEQKLARLVEAGRLTEEQANEYREWYQSRPEGIAPETRFGRHGGHGRFGRGGRGRFGSRGFGSLAPQTAPPVSDLSTSS